MRRKLSLVLLVGLSVLNSIAPLFAQSESWHPSELLQQIATSINESEIRGHIRFLADDLLEGRGPGTRGDELTQLYISTQLEAMGIEPAGESGTWFQPVSMVGIRTAAPEQVEFKTTAGEPEQTITLKHVEDLMLVGGEAEEQVQVDDAELIFVGYGIQAPEYQWDDFKGIDVKGKILVVMNNDPEDDPNLFEGAKRLYYGRWDYKYTKAAELGAAGALIIHTTESAGYPYQVVQTSWSGEEFTLGESTGPGIKIKGWLTENAARKVVGLNSFDLDELRAKANSRDFQPVSLGVKTSITLRCAVRKQETANVFGRVEGSDPALNKEHVIFMAHHDHLGIADERDATGDYIYNGAIDNASGTAALLAIARAIRTQATTPKRSILFAFVGAEEQGLLGSKFFAKHPTIAPGLLAAVINIDGFNFLGRTKDINLIGNGKSSLDQVVANVAHWQGRTVVPDYFPSRGYYYRSDQFSLAQIGVPGVYLHSGIHVMGKPDGWGKEQLEQWVEKDYHQTSDEYNPEWDLSGAVEDIRLLTLVGMSVAEQNEMPAWIKGDEFEAARLKALADRPTQ